jgi:hypothetical protein
MMTIEQLLEQQQKIQMQNPPSSSAWQDASKRIHELAEQLTGKKPQDACGKAIGVICCEATFETADEAWKHERCHVLDKCRETITAIYEQWEEKKLDGDFFTTPYELQQLVHELHEEYGQRD